MLSSKKLIDIVPSSMYNLTEQDTARKDYSSFRVDNSVDLHDRN